MSSLDSVTEPTETMSGNTLNTTAPLSIKTVCFIGAGTMGCYNALIASLAGYQVHLYDRSAMALNAAPANMQGFGEILVQHGIVTDELVKQAVNAVKYFGTLEQALLNVDLVSESIVEDPAIKRDMLSQLDVLCPPNVLLTTNASLLQPSELDSALIHGSRFAALHSHLMSPLIDVLPGPRAAAYVTPALIAYAESLGCIPLLLLKESRGYVLNAMMSSLLSTALALKTSNASNIETIDASWMSALKATMGPFGLMDFFGIDVVYHGKKQQLIDTPIALTLNTDAIELLQQFISKEQLGCKSGRGFYHYPDAAFSSPTFLENAEQQIYLLLVCAVIRAAIELDQNGICATEDINRAWQVAMQLKGGPFDLLNKLPPNEFTSALNTLADIGLITNAQRMSAEQQAAKYTVDHVAPKA